MERGLAVLAGAHRQALIVLVLATSVASATPTKKAAKVLFQAGVTAYTHGEFAKAASSFARSYRIEADADALFGWAQSERKLARCDKAITLYEKLLALDIPQQNKDAVKEPLAECEQVVSTQAQPPTETHDPADDPGETPTEPTEPTEPPPPHVPRDTSPVRHGRPWYADPVGDSLVGVGVIGMAVGGALLLSAHAADVAKDDALNYEAYRVFEQRAADRGQQGVIAAVAGGGLFVAGIVWYATHRDKHDTTVTSWLVPGGGGLALMFKR